MFLSDLAALDIDTLEWHQARNENSLSLSLSPSLPLSLSPSLPIVCMAATAHKCWKEEERNPPPPPWSRCGP